MTRTLAILLFDPFGIVVQPLQPTLGELRLTSWGWCLWLEIWLYCCLIPSGSLFNPFNLRSESFGWQVGV